MSCRLCGSTDVGDVVLRISPPPFTGEDQGGGYQLIRCPQCGLVRTEGAGLDLDYDADYYSAHMLQDTMRSLRTGGARVRLTDFAYAAYMDGGSSWLRRLAALPVRNRLGGLPPRHGSGRRLLDVGSGDGDFLRRAKTAGYEVVGQEVNAAAVASAQGAGLDVRLGPLEEAGFPSQSFDAVRLWHVLEHVAEPLRILRTARALVRPSGVLIVGVPDFDSPARRIFGAEWGGLQLPFHRHHFNPTTLRRALGASGFRVRSLRHRSVGTIYSSLTQARRIPQVLTAPTWLGLLLVDDALDLAGQGDTLEALASPS
jgi:2-polyprenyl-3-methyl-5-hydroxy-6-metoxy-1,4-benzoquinol methylase